MISAQEKISFAVPMFDLPPNIEDLVHRVRLEKGQHVVEPAPKAEESVDELSEDSLTTKRKGKRKGRFKGKRKRRFRKSFPEDASLNDAE